MTTRTVKIFGLAYGPSPAEITVTLDGNNVYTGPVTTIDAPMPSMPDEALNGSTVEFCNFELPIYFSGTKPMTCSVSTGTVVFAQIDANYYLVSTSPDIGSGADGYTAISGAVDARSNVMIDGTPQIINRGDYAGTWWYKVSAGSTLSYDLVAVAGNANVAPV